MPDTIREQMLAGHSHHSAYCTSVLLFLKLRARPQQSRPGKAVQLPAVSSIHISACAQVVMHLSPIMLLCMSIGSQLSTWMMRLSLCAAWHATTDSSFIHLPTRAGQGRVLLPEVMCWGLQEGC